MRARPAHCVITSPQLYLVDNLGWWASAKGCAGIPWGGAGGIGSKRSVKRRVLFVGQVHALSIGPIDSLSDLTGREMRRLMAGHAAGAIVSLLARTPAGGAAWAWAGDGRRRLSSSTSSYQTWPMYEKIIRTPGNENTAEKVRKALAEIDRILDIMEPGTLALSFNGGKDACAMMHLVREACEPHRTHKFTHVQPIWFKNPTDEFPELVDFVKQQADLYFTHPSQVRAMDGSPLNRLWTLHIANEKDFISGLAKVQRQVPLRCIIMGTRRTDPGCGKLASLTASTGNYPPFLRFNPILEWSYRDVWDFILACELPYCQLYDQGYTSIGTVQVSVLPT